MTTNTVTTRHNKRSMRMIWKTLRLRHLGLAFFWACSMLTFRSTFLLGKTHGTPENATFVVIASFAINAATLFLISSFIEQKPSRYEKIPPTPFALSIALGIVTLNSVTYLGNELTLPLIFAGSFFTGVGYGYFWGSWAQILGQMHPSRTSFYLPVVFLLTTALYLAISLGNDLLGIPILALMIPLPLLSLLCLKRCRSQEDLEKPRHTESSIYLSALSSLWSLILASLILSCLFGFMWEMTVFSLGSVNEAHQLPLIVNCIVALALILLVIFARTRIDITLAYRVIVPSIVVAFVIMPFFWEENPLILNTIVSASYGAFDVIIWYVVAATAYDFSASGFIIGSLVRALSIISRLLGIGIGYMVMMIPDRPDMVIVGISLGALYLLGLLFVFYKRRQTKGQAVKIDDTEPNTAPSSLTENEQLASKESAPSSSQEATMLTSQENADERAESLYENIAEDYGLTRREAEVLPYLARGRSAKIIADALYVSESTIRTHTRRILEKTDLHSKQALIDLIERYQ